MPPRTRSKSKKTPVRFANLEDNSKRRSPAKVTIDARALRNAIAILMFFNMPNAARAVEMTADNPSIWKKISSGVGNIVINTLTALEKTTHAAQMTTQALNTTATRVDQALDTAGGETIWLIQHVKDLFPWMGENIKAVAVILLTIFFVGNIMAMFLKHRAQTRKINREHNTSVRQINSEERKAMYLANREHERKMLEIRAQTLLALAEMRMRQPRLSNNSNNSNTTNFLPALRETERGLARLSLTNGQVGRILGS